MSRPRLERLVWVEYSHRTWSFRDNAANAYVAGDRCKVALRKELDSACAALATPILVSIGLCAPARSTDTPKRQPSITERLCDTYYEAELFCEGFDAGMRATRKHS